MYVSKSGFLVHVCERSHDGNERFTGYRAKNYQWQWHEVDRLALVHQTTWGGHTLLFAWPAPGYVPLADDHRRRFGQPTPVWQRAFRGDGWLIRARA